MSTRDENLSQNRYLNWEMVVDRISEIEAQLARLNSVDTKGSISDNDLARIAAAFHRTRKRRAKYFTADLFGEPAWDLLIQLFINHVGGEQLTVTNLYLAADVPQSTGLRYLSMLERDGLAECSKAEVDRRMKFVEISPVGYRKMRRFIVEGIAKLDVPTHGARPDIGA